MPRGKKRNLEDGNSWGRSSKKVLTQDKADFGALLKGSRQTASLNHDEMQAAHNRETKLEAQEVESEAVKTFVDTLNQMPDHENQRVWSFLSNNHPEVFQNNELNMESMLNLKTEGMKEIANEFVSLAGNLEKGIADINRLEGSEFVDNAPKLHGMESQAEVLKNCGMALHNLAEQKESGVDVNYDKDGDISNLSL